MQNSHRLKEYFHRHDRRYGKAAFGTKNRPYVLFKISCKLAKFTCVLYVHSFRIAHIITEKNLALSEILVDPVKTIRQQGFVCLSVFFCF